MLIETTFDPVDPKEAIAYFRKKVPMTSEHWDALEDANNDSAFRMAGVADIDIVQDVYDALDRSISNGTTFEDFKADVADKLEDAWGGTVANPGARLETIFRTNIQTSYMAGHFEQAIAQKDDRPYAMFDPIPDEALCEDCNAVADEMGNQAIPLEEWSGEIPPLHHECRCGWITLSAEEAAEQGILEEMPDLSSFVGEGFDHAPGYEWEPDPDDYDDDIANDVERFVDAG